MVRLFGAEHLVIFDLGNDVTYQINEQDLTVSTFYKGGFVSHATRALTEENLREANEQGYNESNSCWHSLIHHEILHTLVAREVWGTESKVLRHECGLFLAPYVTRLLEETFVISAQYWLNMLYDPTQILYLGQLLNLKKSLDNLGISAYLQRTRPL